MTVAKLTFDDEFNTLSLGNTSVSNWQTGFWYDTTHENNGWWTGAYPTRGSPYVVSNGWLNMTIRTTPAADLKAVGGVAFEAAQLTTYQSFSQLYGYFEMRAQFPARPA